ncbi:MAG: regulatory iron-sulfur-containing complex subunit RicT [Meiothermus sp.]|nr:regulatory iron-sulfur-containing complex subunit RicT [Meiothermus sp.]
MECVGVKFAHSPKIYDYAISDFMPEIGSWVVVKTSRGLELAKVRTEARLANAAGQVIRLATPEDMDNHSRLKARSEEVQWWLKARLRREGVQAKVLGCEFTLDANHVAVHYSAEERIDLRRWVSELNKLAGARVEFVAMGPRDQTAYLGAVGSCGMETCCSTWLQDFAQVSIKMARDQQLPLSPEKISGPCGRLLCCLQYEHDHYQELLADLPRKNAKVCSIHDVCGKVAKLNPLAGTVDLITEQGSWVTVHKSELRKE